MGFALNLQALQQTIKRWQDLKTLISSIYQNPEGTLGLNTAAPVPSSGPQTNFTFSSGAITNCRRFRCRPSLLCQWVATGRCNHSIQ